MSDTTVNSTGYAHTPYNVEDGKCHPLAKQVHAAYGQFHNSIETWEKTKYADPFAYSYGYGNELSSEAVAGAYPLLGNTPQRAPFGLYAEQLSGTSFTTPRVNNRKTWLYKIRPSAAHAPFKPYDRNPLVTNDSSSAIVNPNQLRWKPFPLPPADKNVDFVDGLVTLGVSGDVGSKAGMAIHVYSCNTDMKNRAFCNSDGDFLIVPQLTPLMITTEMGKLRVAPGEFIVIPRGIKFSVNLDLIHDYLRKDSEENYARGYICEVYDGHFVIPDLGPIGSNGLANPKHFAAPTAFYENTPIEAIQAKTACYELIQKFAGKLFHTTLESSPFDIVAWGGNYLPFKYDMANYNTINSVSYDHLDPSIFTVLTVQTAYTGVAACDFVIFPPRFAVQEDTFRPPYYHRNIMTEFMGNVMGQYDAKPEGFVPGSASLHSCMVGHGPDSNTYDRFSDKEQVKLQPTRMSKNDLAFMFESTYILKLTPWANDPERLQNEYYKCWMGLKNDFDNEKTQ